MIIKTGIQHKILITCAILVFFGFTVSAQILINEFSASNSTQIEDTDYSNYSDWIELYNSGSSSVNIKGYYLTDNLSEPSQWKIDEDIIITAGGHVLIWADGNNSLYHSNFKLSADGEEIGLYNSQLTKLDSVVYSTQSTDISYGRKTDGSSSWGYFTTATPGTANTTTAYSELGCNLPEFSVRGGFYDTSISVELSSYKGGDIYYTLDGTDPQLTSSKYSGTIGISKTTILRARIFKTDCVPGTVATQSYFINDNSVNKALPVVSIATDPDNFWDATKGIYVQSYKPEWEVPINIEFFENNRADRSAFNELAGAKVNGLYSWQLPEKMLGIYFRSQYGNSNLDYKLTWQRNRSSYKNFALRASGDDWSSTLFRDVLGQQATLLNMNIDMMGFRPAILYVNGQYMGIHNIREKVDDDYIEKSYNMESGTFDMVENETYAEAGDLTQYNYFLTVLKKGLSSDANYQAVANLMDIENFTDYIIAEMADGNFSVDHNIMCWKPKDSGKWKWILMDLDRGFETATSNLISFYKSESGFPLKELLDNSTYKAYFGKRLAAHLYTSYNPIRIKSLIAERKAAIVAEIPNHIARWKGTTSDYGNAIPSYTYWETEVASLETFADARPTALLSDLKNYGFSSAANLILKTYPLEAGKLTLEGLTIPDNNWSGKYLTNLATSLKAENTPGYTFLGWASSTAENVISSGDTWKYYDLGTNLGTTWTASSYDDSSWKTGPTEMGYGDGDEATTIGYGSSTSNRYITSYFRKSFSLTAEQMNGSFTINLLKDDGAIVYVNGKEVIRANMGTGTINYQSTATSAISGTTESTFTAYNIDNSYFVEGANTISVEVHQNSSSSSDVSFNLTLTCSRPNTSSFISTASTYNLTMTGETSLTAVYEKTSQCLIPTEISSDLTLSAECSPYLATGDITVSSGATLTIEPGVEIQMPKGANLFVKGALNANGTAEKGIKFNLNPVDAGSSWGIISFNNTDNVSTLKYVTVEDASKGPNLAIEIAAITAFNADLVMDHITIEKVFANPIMARYSDITLTNSSLADDVTGDLINVKYGKAFINNCKFTGNNQVDADGIDYDEVENGVIKNCTIYGFTGSNSDAIDIGEKTSNLLIDSVSANSIFDKGVSVGQQSTVTIKNSVFVNCSYGVAVKDSSEARISNCVFYGNVKGVACYEKNLGHAGGNATITNSIISNNSSAGFSADAKSTFSSSYCLTDAVEYTKSTTDITGNPYFENPVFNKFSLLSNSPAINSGFYNGNKINMGTLTDASMFGPNIMITQFFVNADNQNLPEFITLYNPTSETVDLSNYSFSEGISTTIPVGTSIAPNDIIYLTNDATLASTWLKNKEIIQWESGKLSNDGETIKILDSYGILRDFVSYDKTSSWPADGFVGNNVFKLKTTDVDNHFGENWEVVTLNNILSTPQTLRNTDFTVYPNPTNAIIKIKANGHENSFVQLINSTGQIMLNSQLDSFGSATVDISKLPLGMYIVVIDAEAQKVILTK